MSNDNNSTNENTIQYKKELKIIDGEERAAIKKAKGSLGKKAKDVIEQIEKDYKIKCTELEEKYRSLSSNSTTVNNDIETNNETNTENNGINNNSIQEVEQQMQLLDVTINDNTNTSTEKDTNNNNNTKAMNNTNNKKISKYKKKKEIERNNEIQKQNELQNSISYRDIELHIINTILQQYNLQISFINPDGNCLYTSIANQLNRILIIHQKQQQQQQQGKPEYNYSDIRTLCAKTLLQNQTEFESFCELYDTSTNTEITFEQYVTNVQTKSQCWGGHLELRVLSKALNNRPIYIYSNPNPITSSSSSETTDAISSAITITTNQPLIIQYNDTDPNNTTSDTTTVSSTISTTTLEPIRLSYHLHYYALGEHYNEVIPIEK